MAYDVSEQERKLARHPHEIFLINLITNHIFLFIAALSVASSKPFMLLVIPVVSVILLSYILIRAKKSLTTDPWFVKCHWQVAARRSKIFLMIVSLLIGVMIFTWVGYHYLGMPKVAVYAFAGGIGGLPVMVAVLVLVMMETESLQTAKNGDVPRWAEETFPNPDMPRALQAEAAE